MNPKKLKAYQRAGKAFLIEGYITKAYDIITEGVKENPTDSIIIEEINKIKEV